MTELVIQSIRPVLTSQGDIEAYLRTVSSSMTAPNPLEEGNAQSMAALLASRITQSERHHRERMQRAQAQGDEMQALTAALNRLADVWVNEINRTRVQRDDSPPAGSHLW